MTTSDRGDNAQWPIPEKENLIGTLIKDEQIWCGKNNSFVFIKKLALLSRVAIEFSEFKPQLKFQISTLRRRMIALKSSLRGILDTKYFNQSSIFLSLTNLKEYGEKNRSVKNGNILCRKRVGRNYSGPDYLFDYESGAQIEEVNVNLCPKFWLIAIFHPFLLLIKVRRWNEYIFLTRFKHFVIWYFYYFLFRLVNWPPRKECIFF